MGWSNDCDFWGPGSDGPRDRSLHSLRFVETRTKSADEASVVPHGTIGARPKTKHKLFHTTKSERGRKRSMAYSAQVSFASCQWRMIYISPWATLDHANEASGWLIDSHAVDLNTRHQEEAKRPGSTTDRPAIKAFSSPFESLPRARAGSSILQGTTIIVLGQAPTRHVQN